MSNYSQDANQEQSNVIDFSTYRGQRWFCLIARFSMLESKPDDWFATLLAHTNACMGDTNTRAFLFADDEVHILLSRASQEGLNDLVRQLSTAFGADMQEMIHLYEVEIAPGETIPDAWKNN